MAIGLIFLLFILAVFMPKSKMLYFGIMLYMWLLFSLNTGAPDTSIYEWLYGANIPHAFEPLFTALMTVCQKLHFPYFGFRMAVISIMLVFLHLAFKVTDQYKTLALAMYLVSPFPWQVSGIRAALACAILIYAMASFAEDPKKNTIKYCVFLLIATLVHYSSVLFAVLLLARIEPARKRIVTYLVIGIIGTMIVQHSDILFELVSRITDREKILTWLSGGAEKEGYPSLTGFAVEMIVLVGNIVLTAGSRMIVSQRDPGGEKTGIANLICDMNVITLLFLPFFRLNDTYMRLLYAMHGLNVILYSMTAFMLQEKEGTPNDGHACRSLALRTQISLYTLIVPLWTYLIAIYQNWPYFGTEESVFSFLGKNLLF